MPYVIGAVVLVGALCLLNLIISLGVIRRLRDHSDHLSRLLRGSAHASNLLAPGTPLSDFATTTTDGEPLSLDSLQGQTTVGIFSPGCAPCKELLPEFIKFASGVPGGRQQVLAVIAGGPEEARDYIGLLAPVARVVLDEHGGPVLSAFAAQEFPALYVIDSEHKVETSAVSLEQLPAPALV